MQLAQAAAYRQAHMAEAGGRIRCRREGVHGAPLRGQAEGRARHRQGALLGPGLAARCGSGRFRGAGFCVFGARRRLGCFALTFPFSNAGLAQVLPGENAECVCQAPRDIFEYIGGAPARFVFDNAAGIGRKTGGAMGTAEPFPTLTAHCGFAFSPCNPRSGHEKGPVENKVGYIRRNLFVPIPSFDSGRRLSKTPPARRTALSEKPHWIKGEDERALLTEDTVALLGPPSASFDAVRYERGGPASRAASAWRPAACARLRPSSR